MADESTNDAPAHEANDHQYADHEADHHAHQPGHQHGHGHGHLDEADWARWAADTEREGEVLIEFVTGTADRIARVAPGTSVHRILDIGAGPAVASCEFARLFPEADVVAVDSSPGMLEHAARRIESKGLGARVRTASADLGGGLDSLGPADLIWASMSLHHVGDEVAALRSLRTSLSDGGILAIAEMADPMRFVPDPIHPHTPHLVERIDQAFRTWFAAMRAGLESSVESRDLAVMVGEAGFTILDDQVVTVRLDPPLSADARALITSVLQRSRHQLQELLDDHELRAIDVLLDPADDRSIARRPDCFIEATRRIIIAR